MLRLLVATLLGVLVSCSGFGSSAAVGTPVASPEASPTTPAYLAGNGYDLIPHGEAGKLDVLIVGPLVGNELPIVIRNNTKERLDILEATAVAKDARGTVLAKETSEYIYHRRDVPPGEISLASIYFDQPDKLSGAAFTVTARGDQPDPARLSDYRSLTVTEVTLQTDHLSGTVQNAYQHSVETASVYGPCFNAAGAITGYFEGSISSDIGPNGNAPFVAPLYGPDSCERFVVIAIGFSSEF